MTQQDQSKTSLSWGMTEAVTSTGSHSFGMWQRVTGWRSPTRYHHPLKHRHVCIYWNSVTSLKNWNSGNITVGTSNVAPAILLAQFTKHIMGFIRLSVVTVQQIWLYSTECEHNNNTTCTTLFLISWTSLHVSASFCAHHQAVLKHKNGKYINTYIYIYIRTYIQLVFTECVEFHSLTCDK
jgi:hypothetical protein